MRRKASTTLANMTRSPSQSLLDELQNPKSHASLIAALISLKNEIIGHEQRKKVWIGYGIVPILSRILSDRRGDTGKRSSREAAQDTPAASRSVVTDDDTACLHATVITGNIAQAGSAFVSPILASGIVPRLMSILSAPNCPQPLTIAILKTLCTIADRLSPQNSNEWPVDRQLANGLYSKEHVGVLATLLGQSSASSSVQHSITLVAGLISKTCLDEAHKTILTDSGVLDALSVRLASFVVSQGFVLPGAEGFVHEPGSLGTLPPSAPPKAQLAPIIQCISIIIDHSRKRTEQFLLSPAIVTVFPRTPPDSSPTENKRSHWSTTTSPYLSGHGALRSSSTNPIDSLLPTIPTSTSRQSNPNFPPLGSNGSFSRNGSFMSLSFDEQISSFGSIDEDESALVSWLIYLIRSDKSVAVRLRAAKILITLFRHGMVKKERLQMLSMLLVPLLVGLLDRETDLSSDSDAFEIDVLPSTLRTREEVPHLLASLVMDSPELQKAAFEAQAIKRLSELLKRTFDPLPDHAKGMWTPEKTPKTPRNRTESELSLGPPAPTPLARHTMRFREGILLALASISPFKNDYRTAICDQGVVPYIIDSLKPYTTIPHLSDTGSGGPHMIPGNPTATLLAACSAARALTRSVSVLRTTLNDAGIGPPIFTLVKNKDIEVQIAATAVICNLALDFSPMREDVINHGIYKTLCEHAHSANVRLRLDSVWALKHLVYNSTNEIKIKVCEELGLGWMTSVLSTDPSIDEKRWTDQEDFGRPPLPGLGNINAAGEPIDLLNPKDETSEDVSMSEAPVNRGLENFRLHAAQRRRAERGPDLGYTVLARKEDIEIQEQILDLIRNIVCGPGASDMIDYLFKEMCQADFFALLLSKIRTSRPVSTPSKSNPKITTSPSSAPPPIPTEILQAVTYILVHIAASHSRHRRILISQTELLRQVVPLFDHPHRVVRVNCCWITINLTYEDDHTDKMGLKQRARELEKLGVVDRLVGLNEDIDLDVRERTKVALLQLGSLLGRD